MRAEEGDESIRDYAAEAAETQARVKPDAGGSGPAKLVNRLLGVFRRK